MHSVPARLCIVPLYQANVGRKINKYIDARWLLESDYVKDRRRLFPSKRFFLTVPSHQEFTGTALRVFLMKRERCCASTLFLWVDRQLNCMKISRLCRVVLVEAEKGKKQLWFVFFVFVKITADCRRKWENCCGILIYCYQYKQTLGSQTWRSGQKPKENNGVKICILG